MRFLNVSADISDDERIKQIPISIEEKLDIKSLASELTWMSTVLLTELIINDNDRHVLDAEKYLWQK